MSKKFKPKPFLALIICLLGASTGKAQFTMASYSIVPQLSENVDSVVAYEFMLSPAIGKYRAGKDSLFKYTEVYEDHRLIEQYQRSYLTYPHTGKDSRPVKYIYSYDIVGNLTGFLRFFTTGEPWSKETDFVSGLHVRVITTFLPDNSSPGKTEFILNAFHKITERKDYMTTGEVYTTSYYKYDEKNRQIEDECHRGDGSLMYIHTSKYDEKAI